MKCEFLENFLAQNDDFLPLQILKILNNAGFEAIFVGGCVRDCLLEILPKDWDIATSATPQNVAQILKNANLQNLKIDLSAQNFGSVKAIFESKICEIIEITTFRIEKNYDDFRRPNSVIFTKDFSLDVKRRDFTINALGYDLQRGVLDFCGGLDDLKKRKIVCVIDALESFKKDHLRIMRAFRFAGVLDFEISDSQKCAINFLGAKVLQNISLERVKSEFDKLLMGVGAQKIFSEFNDFFEQFFEIFLGAKIEKNVDFQNLDLENLDSVNLRYAKFFWEFNADLQNSKFRFSKAQIRQIQAILNICKRLKNNEFLELFLDFSESQIQGALKIKNDKKLLVNFQNLKEQNLPLCLKDLQINGDEILKMQPNIKGEKIAQILKMLLLEVLQGAIKNDAQLLVKRAATLLPKIMAIKDFQV